MIGECHAAGPSAVLSCAARRLDEEGVIPAPARARRVRAARRSGRRADPTTELKVGDQAPDFTLQATDGKTYTLSKELKGKWVVLAWFPKAFTAG